MSAIRFLAVISGFARRRTAFAALPLLFACASLISGCSGGGGGGGGGGVRAGGGNASISQPSPASRGNSALVVVSNSGIAGARSTLTLEANVDGDNGTGVNWVVAQCTTAGCSQPVTDGSVGTITTHTASGATATYTAPTSVLPSASFVGIFAKQPGTPGQPDGPYSKGFGVLPVPTPNALVTGTFTVNAAGGFNFVFRVRGFTANGLTYAMIGRFHLDSIGSPTPADGSGITAGLMDVNIAQPDGSSKTYTKVPFGGGYNMDTSSHGTAKLTFTGTPPWSGITNPLPTTTMNFAFTLNIDGTGADLVETDAGFQGSGDFQSQDPLPTDFNTTFISGTYVFFLAGPGGAGVNAVQHGVVGRLNLTQTGNTGTTGTTASIDSTTVPSIVDDESGNHAAQAISGTLTLDSTFSDHGYFNIVAGASTPQVSFYIVSPRDLLALETDPNPAANPPSGVLAGAMSAMATGTIGPPFSSGSLNGPFTVALSGITPSSAANGQGHASVAIARFSGTNGASDAGTLTGFTDFNDGGYVPGGLPLSFQNATFTIAADGYGRGTFSFPITIGTNTVTYNFVFYQASLQGSGYMLEQPATDGSNRGRFGIWQLQSITAPVTASSLGANSTYIGDLRTSTAASLNTVDVFTLNGGTYQNVANSASGTFAVTDQTNGRGTITQTTGKLFNNASAAFLVTWPGRMIAVGTDSTNQEPQVIFLDQ